MAYVKKAFARLARIGTHIVVFGSGGARQVPEGFAKDRGVSAARRLRPPHRARGEGARHHGRGRAAAARRKPTSSTRRPRGSTLVNAIADPNFQLMVDFYHLASEKEDPAIVVRARRSHPAPPHGQPERTRVPALVGRVRLRAVLRGAADRSATTGVSAWRRRRRISRRGAAGDRASATQVPVALRAPAPHRSESNGARSGSPTESAAGCPRPAAGIADRSAPSPRPTSGSRPPSAS